MLLDSSKYNISEERKSHYETVMYLTVKRWRKRDDGHFKCISKNSLGTADGRIQTYSKCSFGWVINSLIYAYSPVCVSGALTHRDVNTLITCFLIATSCSPFAFSSSPPSIRRRPAFVSSDGEDDLDDAEQDHPPPMENDNTEGELTQTKGTRT